MPNEACLKTSFVYGPCAAERSHASGDPAHVIGMKIYCAEHCQYCHPDFVAPMESRPVTGEQMEMFT